MARLHRLEILRKLHRQRQRKARQLYEAEMREKLREVLRVSEIPTADTPGVDGLPVDNDYSGGYIRGPRDVVISGPVGKKVDGSKTPGRWFATGYDALCWAEEKYGRERVTLILDEGSGTRWAVLVKSLRR